MHPEKKCIDAILYVRPEGRYSKTAANPRPRGVYRRKGYLYDKRSAAAGTQVWWTHHAEGSHNIGFFIKKKNFILQAFGI